MVSKIIAIIGVKASNDRVFHVPIIFNEFIYKVSPIAIPTIPLTDKTRIDLKYKKNNLSIRRLKKIEARIFL